MPVPAQVNKDPPWQVTGYCWFYGLIAAVRWRMKNIRPPEGGFDPLRFLFAIAAPTFATHSISE